MASLREVEVAANSITVRRSGARVAVVGPPNSGKSTLFNRLTGLRQRIGNYPGVTVERRTGSLTVRHESVELIDLPGTHSLSAHSLEEKTSIDLIFGRIAGTPAPDGILAVLDATNLYQGLFLMQQLVDLGMPMVIALTMTDAAEQNGIDVDTERLSAALGGAQVVRVIATTGTGIDELKAALVAMPKNDPPTPLIVWPELATAARKLQAKSNDALKFVECERLLVDGVTTASASAVEQLDDEAQSLLSTLRDELFGLEPPLATEARVRYAWVREHLDQVQKSAPAFLSWRSRLTDFVNRPVPGTIGLFLVMALVFQAVFAWATPMMDLIDAAAADLGGVAAAALGHGWLASLVADGVIAGVGSVIIFLPQILILFLFIILLEDTGYLARAAYLPRSCHAFGRIVRPVDYSDDFEFRLRGARYHGDAGHPESARSNCHHHCRTVHDVFGTIACLCVADCRIRAAATGRLV